MGGQVGTEQGGHTKGVSHSSQLKVSGALGQGAAGISEKEDRLG